MLYYDRIDFSEGIDVNKIIISKECDVCHYCYFLSFTFKFHSNVSNRCQNFLMISVNLINNAI